MGRSLKKGPFVDQKLLAKIDKMNERFSLGIKQLTDDPWRSVPSRYFLGQQLEGKVVHVADFGAFVELEEGVEGLVHISELAHDIMSEDYEPGKKLKIEIISLDPHEQKIGLSEIADGEERAPIQEVTAHGSTLADVMGGDLLATLQGSGAETPVTDDDDDDDAPVVPAKIVAPPSDDDAAE